MTKQQQIAEGYALQEAVIAEMTTDGKTVDDMVDVPVNPQLLKDIAKGDENPMFVTIEVLNESTSNNGRRWTREAILQVAETINAEHPDGYWGHLKTEERSTKFPDPTTVWLGAKVEEVNGKVHLYAKGYVLPEAKPVRSYLEKAKAAGKHVAVSVYGKTYAMTKAGLTDMRNFVLESIDWARPKSAGLNTLGKFVITAEMTDDSNKLEEGENNEMTREEVLRTATADEIKELNSEVVSEMTQEAVSAKEAEYEAVVSEMTEVREALAVEDDKSLSEVVKEMVEEREALVQQNRQHALDAKLNEIESPAARNVIKSLVVAEMTADEDVAGAVDRVLASDTGKGVIHQFVDQAPKIAPQTHRPTATARKFTKKV